MADIARLGLAVDSSQVEKGTVSLHQLTGAAGQAAAAAQRLGTASGVEAAGVKTATAATMAHTAALNVQNNVMRSTAQQRTMMVYQLNDIAVSLASGMNPAMVAMQQGSQILQGGLMPAVRTLTDMAKGLLATFWPVAAVIGAVSLAVAGLTHEINETAAVQVGFFDVALAGWQLFAESVASLVAPVFSAIGGWLQQGWDAAVPILKAIGNAIIGTFVGSFEAIKAVWSNLPAALGDWAYQAAQVVADAFTTMGQNVIISINQTINAINAKFGSSMPTLGIPYKIMPGAVVGNPYAGSGEKLTSGVSDAFGSAMEKDYMGDAFGAISGRAQEIAAARKEVEELGGAAGAANDNAKTLGATLSDAAKAAKAEWDFYRGTFNGFFSDLSQGLKDGEGFWQSFGNAAANALNGIAERLMGMASNGLFDMLFGALGNSLGGGWGVQGGFSGFKGTFGIPGMATGGTVGRGGLSWVGEQGPELLSLPQGAQVIPNGPSMSMAANGSNDNRPHFSPTFNINGSGLSQAQLQQTIQDALDHYDRFQAPQTFNRVQNDPTARG